MTIQPSSADTENLLPLQYARRLHDLAINCEIDNRAGDASDLRRIAGYLAAIRIGAPAQAETRPEYPEGDWRAFEEQPTQGGDKGEVVGNKCLRFIKECEDAGSIDHAVAFELVNILTAPQPAMQGDKAAMDDQRDPDATRALRMEQFDEEHRKSQDTAVTWPPLKKALWNVLMTENLNDGHYIKAFDLIEKLYAAALASEENK